MTLRHYDTRINSIDTRENLPSSEVNEDGVMFLLHTMLPLHMNEGAITFIRYHFVIQRIAMQKILTATLNY